jgi:HK97 family phage major capsid protein
MGDKMSEEIIKAVNDGIKGVEAKLAAAVEKYEGQAAQSGRADNEIRAEVKSLSEKFEASLTEIAQKMATAEAPSVKSETAGAEFVKSEAFKSVQQNRGGMARLEVKNTLFSDATTTYPDQRPGIIPGTYVPLTIRSRMNTINVTSNALTAMKESSWTNNAAETAQGAQKPESALVLTPYNVVIETVAHWIKVSSQLVADAPAVMALIDTRLRDGLAQRIERQLLLGNGTSPNLSGLTDAGNFTAFTADAGANVVDAINKAVYQLWATGDRPDTAILNPADWGAMVASKGSDGHYLYGVPGFAANTNPFGVEVVLSTHMPAGFFLVGALRSAATIYQRSGAVVEMGFVNDDFTRNLVTIRAEERLGLGVDRPSAILYGDYSA